MNTITHPDKDILHSMKVKLHTNYLPTVEGKFVARTENESFLSVDDICLTLTQRAGFIGKYQDLVGYVKQFLDEAVYHLCDGYGINMGYFSISPNIGGTFNSAADPHEAKKNPINFKFRTLRPLRNLTKHIEVKINGLASSNAYIDEFTDEMEKSTNELYLPGDMFSITGSKIKVAGDDPDCGVYFVPVDAPTAAVKVQHFAENSTSKIIGIAPNTHYIRNRIEIRTQFSGSATVFLKAPRVITSGFILETA